MWSKARSPPQPAVLTLIPYRTNYALRQSSFPLLFAGRTAYCVDAEDLFFFLDYGPLPHVTPREAQLQDFFSLLRPATLSWSDSPPPRFLPPIALPPPPLL